MPDVARSEARITKDAFGIFSRERLAETARHVFAPLQPLPPILGGISLFGSVLQARLPFHDFPLGGCGKFFVTSTISACMSCRLDQNRSSALALSSFRACCSSSVTIGMRAWTSPMIFGLGRGVDAVRQFSKAIMQPLPECDASLDRGRTVD